ncbi:hypothetical protein SAMN05216243_2738 [Sediminibacillus albus]|uniref:Uncharacterized protein n=1 Tax=Sediminibacillus albus TaxID=407036 RepID=A0A1G9AV14_9BACI|nr:hypothetical protein SAMN05216243_2738 [Sediminibacillus albus]
MFVNIYKCKVLYILRTILAKGEVICLSEMKALKILSGFIL